MTTALDPLVQHLQAYHLAIEAGVPVAWARHRAGESTRHAHLGLLSYLRDARLIRTGLWGHRSALLAYEHAARLTPVVLDGLRQPGVAVTLRAQGIDNPARSWLDPFLAIGMEPGPGGTTPTWPG